jgi:hypothetical protein
MAGDFLFLADIERTPEFWAKYQEALRSLHEEEDGAHGYYAGGSLCVPVGEDEVAASPRTLTELDDCPQEVKRLSGELYLLNKTPGHAYWKLALAFTKGEELV